MADVTISRDHREIQSVVKRGRLSGDGRTTMGSKSYFQRRNVELLAQVASLEAQLCSHQPVAPLLEEHAVRRGYVAEHLVRYRMARAGLQFFDPTFQQKNCDLLVRGASGKYYRCEIKGTGGIAVNLVKSRYSSSEKKTKQVHYTAADEIDFFIFVDLHNEVIFVVPFEIVQGQKQFNLALLGKAWKYRERFDLLA